MKIMMWPSHGVSIQSVLSVVSRLLISSILLVLLVNEAGAASSTFTFSARPNSFTSVLSNPAGETIIITGFPTNSNCFEVDAAGRIKLFATTAWADCDRAIEMTFTTSGFNLSEVLFSDIDDMDGSVSRDAFAATVPGTWSPVAAGSDGLFLGSFPLTGSTPAFATDKSRLTAAGGVDSFLARETGDNPLNDSAKFTLTTPTNTFKIVMDDVQGGRSVRNFFDLASLVVTEPIIAVDDTLTTPISTSTAQTNVINVLTGDTLNNVAATPSTVTISVAPSSNLPAGFTLNSDGSVDVAANTAGGNYTFDYQICETGFTPANCDTATVTISVIVDPASFSCSATVDVWYANDESGSVNATEFTDALDFIYQVTDGFYHSSVNGAQGGLIGWAFDATPINVVIPITEDFYDQDDSGLATTGTTVDGDGLGIRENYTAKVSASNGTQLTNATQGLANLINAGNGRRTGVPQVAVILTDAPDYQINDVGYNGGGTAWEAAAANLRAAGPDGTRIVLVLLAEAAIAYDNNAASKATIDSVVGSTGTVIKTDSYALVADAANGFVDQTISDICDAATFPVTDDYSDAPADGSIAPNGTDTTAYGEATHSIVDELQLGSVTDSENTSIASPGATGDGADDDGVTVFPVLTPDSYNYQLSIMASNTSGNPGRLLAWIDFDGNGRFDSDEAAARVIPTGTTNGSFLVTWSSIPPDIQAGNTFLRVRLTTDALNVSLPSGAKPDGEVEDYALTIGAPGARVSGRVYIDTNSSASEDAGEAGISGSVVVLHDTVTGICRSVVTNGNGDYSFAGTTDSTYEIYQAHGESTPVPQNCGTASANNPTGYQSTTPDTLTITVSGADVVDQDFGEVAGANSTTSGNTGAGITFEPDHQGEVLPGNVIFYPHVFSTEADGSVSFTTTDSGNTATGWSHTLYQDSNCNGLLDGTEANTTISGNSISLTEGSQVCIIDKVFAPANVPAQDRYLVETTAIFSYAGGSLSPAVLTVTDVTTAGQTGSAAAPEAGESRLVLRKTVENLTQATAETASANQANPGDVLRYRIYYRNAGTGPITSLTVNDTVPAFTGFVSGSEACDTTPPGMICTPSQNLDALDWTFTGSLVGGAEGHVSYEVMVNN